MYQNYPPKTSKYFGDLIVHNKKKNFFDFTIFEKMDFWILQQPNRNNRNNNNKNDINMCLHHT